MTRKRAVVAAVLACASPAWAVKISDEWGTKTPPGPATRVLVGAMIQEPELREMVEDTIARQLKDRGVEAITVSRSFSPAELQSEEALLARADALGVDGFVALTVIATGTVVQSSPSVGVSVGVPVNIGGLGVFLGGNVPLGGGAKSVPQADLKAEFFHRSSKEPQWTAGLRVAMKDGPQVAAGEVARTIGKSLRKFKLIPKK